MKLQRIRAITRKELIHIRRDPLSMAMAFLLPAILLVIYGYAVTFDVERIETAVCDLDKSSMSRELVNELTRSGYFKVVAYLDGYKEIDYLLDRGVAKVAVAVPVDFSKRVRAGRPATLELVLDGSNSNTASIASGYLSAIAGTYTVRVRGQAAAPLVDARSRVWYNTELRSRNFIIPGLIAVIMAVIVALLTSLTVAREWDRGSMEQLISTPVKPAEVVIGKLIPYFIIGLIDTVLAVFMSATLFGVPLRGSIPLLLALSSIFLFGGLSTGILISIATKTQTVASQVAMLNSFLPAFLLSGFIFSISNMPGPLQGITYLIPARYFVTILKGIFLKGVSLDFLLRETVLLGVYGTGVFLLAIKKFKKRMD